MSRARKVERFLSQPFFVAKVFTGLEGEYVPVAETVESFEAIIDGGLDDLPEQAFLNVGNIDQVQAKAKQLSESWSNTCCSSTPAATCCRTTLWKEPDHG